MGTGSEPFIWLGIAFCISQSALFSGMNLAMFSFSRLRLELERSVGREEVAKILALRADSNFLLTTILWGNVGINVLLTLLSDSVLAGIGAFLFSTFAITIFGEIIPQAYFSRNAIRVGVLLSPVLRLYQILLFPVAKPCALILDAWLGKEGIEYVREHELRALIRQHIDAPEAADIDRLEGLGALNFLTIDDLPVVMEGEAVDPASIIRLPWSHSGLVFPAFESAADDAFLRAVNDSGKKWVILTDQADRPRLVLDADGFLRQVLFQKDAKDPLSFCHQPIIVESRTTPLGSVLSRLSFSPSTPPKTVIDQDVILLWGETRRVITGADILGRLMQGIAVGVKPAAATG